MLRGCAALDVSPGDEVVFFPHYPNNSEKHWCILVVERVTPKAGQIVTRDGRKFEKDGFEIGGTTSYSGGRSSISAATPELRARIDDARNLELLRTTDYTSLSRETVKGLVALIKSDAGLGKED